MTGPAPAKINLALVVGPLRPDGKHELATVFQRIDLVDRITRRARRRGRHRRQRLRRRHDRAPGARACSRRRTAGGSHIDKHMPVAAGLGGGSSDAATALRLANAQLARPLPPAELHDARRDGRRRRPVLPPRRPAARDAERAASSSRSSCRRTSSSCSSCRAARRRSRRPRSTRHSMHVSGAAGFDERAARASRVARSRRAPARPRARCRRTTSHRRRSRAGCARSGASAPT